MKKIWLFHLLNDYSGSPLVLKSTALALRDSAELTICTSPSEGFLSDIEGVKYHPINYKWSPSKITLLLRFFVVQCRYFFVILSNRRKIDVVYVNTLLPFGAALGAKLMGKKVIYHMHEPQVNPALLFRLLVGVANVTAHRFIFVSNYLKSCFPKFASRSEVIFNVLNESFLEKIEITPAQERTTVLMLCSFKGYKGIYEFVALAASFIKVPFELVINASEEEIATFRKRHLYLPNLRVFSSTKDVHQHFRRAKFVLNLSHPKLWTESFGMTALEAMAYGVPCIVPKVGGIAELVPKSAGFTISYDNHQEIVDTLRSHFHNLRAYLQLAKSAKEHSEFFVFDNYKNQLLRLTQSL